jgi:hypothetical protein
MLGAGDSYLGSARPSRAASARRLAARADVKRWSADALALGSGVLIERFLRPPSISTELRPRRYGALDGCLLAGSQLSWGTPRRR